jgi:hypothetical protein
LFFQKLFFEKNPNYSSLNLNLKIAKSSRHSWNPEILGIGKFLESGNAGNPDILGICKFLEPGNSRNPEILGTWKLSKQVIGKQERIAKRVSTRVEI